jgi:hypothetical protein
MHNAPPVAYPVGRFVWGMVLFGGVLLMSAAGLCAWQIQSQASGLLVWCAWVFWAVCGVATAYGAPKQVLSEGHLLWTGDVWMWRSRLGAQQFANEDQDLQLAVGLDWGAGMLLLLRTRDELRDRGGPWFCAWVDAQAMPSKWHGFRCAVYSRPKAVMQSNGSAL